jgi:hypothetical protein
MSPTAAFGAYDTIIDHLFAGFDASVQTRPRWRSRSAAGSAFTSR